MMAAALGLGLVALLWMRRRGGVTPAQAQAATQEVIDALSPTGPDPDAPPRVVVPLDEAGRVTVDEKGIVRVDGAPADAGFHLTDSEASLRALAQGGPAAAAAVEAGQAAVNQAQTTYEREVAQGVHGESARQAQIADDRRLSEAKAISLAFAKQVNRKVKAVLKRDGFNETAIQRFLGLQYGHIRSEMEERTGDASSPPPRAMQANVLRDAYQWKYHRRNYTMVNDDDGNPSHLQYNVFGTPNYTAAEEADMARRRKKADAEIRALLAG